MSESTSPEEEEQNSTNAGRLPGRRLSVGIGLVLAAAAVLIRRR